tara:strand:- start:441 stop:1340 length:900 start_codon:yes stop_codon:yes gene_type:complete
MLLGQLKFDILVHFALTVVAAGALVIRYGGQTNVKNFSWDHTLTGASAIVSAIMAAVSFMNLAGDVLLSDGCEMVNNQKKLKKRMKKEKWNMVRNIFTNLTLVLTAFLVGYTNDMDILTLPTILICLIRVSDVTLDVENVLEIQCTTTDKTESRKLRTAFGALGFVAALVLFIIYTTRIPFDWEGDNTGDEVALVVCISGLSIHLVLVLLHLILNYTGCKDVWLPTTQKNAQGKSENCKDYGIHMPNEIPLVSKVVFTLTIGSLALVVGERLHEEKDITLPIFILILLGAVEMAGRNIL